MPHYTFNHGIYIHACAQCPLWFLEEPGEKKCVCILLGRAVDIAERDGGCPLKAEEPSPYDVDEGEVSC